jgi:NAD(P)H:quinone oxidoreductase type IV
MSPKIMVLYYSMFGNTFLMAKAVASGIKEEGGETVLRTVPESLPKEVIEKDSRIKKAKEMQRNVAIAKVEELAGIDGIILGSPTRFGNMCAQLRNFLDQTGSLWLKGALIDKPTGVFCCTASLHGGQETTLISMMFTLLHHGAIVMGVPYSIEELAKTTRGGTPYGPTAVVGTAGDEAPTEMDLKIARELGKRITRITRKLV